MQPNYELVTYATHSQGMYEQMMNSGYDITVGGYGKKWCGFMDKFHFMIEHTSKLPPDTIVIFLDGFDTLIKQDPEIAVKRFLTMDCKVLFSSGITEKNVPAFMRKRLFGTVATQANTCLYMGYAKELNECLTKTLQLDHLEDDQRAINILVRNEPCGLIKLDLDRRVFCNLAFHERTPDIYDKLDAVFLGFNASPTLWGKSILNKIGFYSGRFKVEIALAITSFLFGIVYLYHRDKNYNCSQITEIFGIVYPVLVIWALLNSDIPDNLFRMALVVSCIMLGFHIGFLLKPKKAKP